MTPFPARRSATAIKRQVILEALKPYTEESINNFTCPSKMTCAGIAKAVGLNPPYVINQVRYLVSEGYIIKLGRRRMSGSRRQASNVLCLTDKGRRALNR